MKFVIVSTRGGKKTRIVKSSTRGEMRRKESEKNRLLEERNSGRWRRRENLEAGDSEKVRATIRIVIRGNAGT